MILAEPRWLSVSRGLYEQGWRGVHFEPLPECATRLRGWDSKLLRSWIVLTKAARSNFPEPCREAWEPMVLAAGYCFALFDGLNRFYVADEHRALLATMAAPNIFDALPRRLTSRSV